MVININLINKCNVDGKNVIDLPLAKYITVIAI
jgi:hypothetical protein